MNSDNHADEDSLERYSLGRFREDGADPLEEHLLTCQACRDRLGHLDRYHRAIRSALSVADCNRIAVKA